MRTIALLATLGTLSISVPSVADAPTYRAPDCPTEDACRIDYTPRGAWRIMQCEGACDDRGARTHWRALYVEGGRR